MCSHERPKYSQHQADSWALMRIWIGYGTAAECFPQKPLIATRLRVSKLLVEIVWKKRRDWSFWQPCWADCRAGLPSGGNPHHHCFRTLQFGEITRCNCCSSSHVQLDSRSKKRLVNPTYGIFEPEMLEPNLKTVLESILIISCEPGRVGLLFIHLHVWVYVHESIHTHTHT